MRPPAVLAFFPTKLRIHPSRDGCLALGPVVCRGMGDGVAGGRRAKSGEAENDLESEK